MLKSFADKFAGFAAGFYTGNRLTGNYPPFWLPQISPALTRHFVLSGPPCWAIELFVALSSVWRGVAI